MAGRAQAPSGGGGAVGQERARQRGTDGAAGLASTHTCKAIIQRAGGARATAAARVQERAAELQLTGTLTTQRGDEWLGSEPTEARRQNVTPLRAAFRTCVRETADNRRLSTAFDRWAGFLSVSGRVPFVYPSAAGGDEWKRLWNEPRTGIIPRSFQ
eukprot:3150039-Pleurochrysis_carterae.AAC.1